MRYAPFGITNLAWPAAELTEALDLVRDTGCTAVEIAPFNVFGRWNDIVDSARRLREAIERKGLVCSALQGILYEVPDATLFHSDASRTRLLRHLESVAALAGLLGAKACVFGAPRQRDPGELPTGEAWAIAAGMLRRIGPAFAAKDSVLAIEPNARQYGCRFVTTTAEAIRLVDMASAPGLGVQIDTGTMLLEAEPPDILSQVSRYAVHAHVSEPDLRPPDSCDHAVIAAALHRSGYSGSMSVEMKCVGHWRTVVPAAIDFVRRTYG